MWKQTDLETNLENAIKADLSDNEKDDYISRYCRAKSYLCNNIYGKIASVEKDLTDHSSTHIENVLCNAWRLIGIDHSFNVVELYILCLSILFHDVGNIEGRKKHQKKADVIYNECYGSSVAARERNLVLSLVKAHCGESKSGDNDTLQDVDETSICHNATVRLRELAAIVRLADELAEGPQRTSQYMQRHGKFSTASLIYHEYANITNVCIDKGNNRIVVVYDIELSDYSIDKLKALLEFIYMRIIKLDNERRYCKYYAQSIDCFKRTEVSINFTKDGQSCESVDKIEITLTDKYPLVEDDVENLQKKYPVLNIDNIIKQLGSI